MFNELYKSANEKFSSDAARDRFMASLDRPSVRKKKNIRPVITSAAALAACFAVTVCGINLYNSRPKPQDDLRDVVPQITASPDTAADVPDTSADSSGSPLYIAGDTDTAVQERKENSRPAQTQRARTEAKKESSSAPQSEETAETAPAAVSPANPKTAAEPPQTAHAPTAAEEVPVPSAPSETDELKKSFAPEMYAASALDINETAADDAAENADCFAAKSSVASERTLDDYIGFIGRDIRDGICIPDGMTDLTPLTDFTGDGWVFIYDGNGKHVQIRTAPQAADAGYSAGGADSAVCAPDETACFSAHGIDFEITAYNFTAEELDALVGSLKK